MIERVFAMVTIRMVKSVQLESGQGCGEASSHVV